MFRAERVASSPQKRPGMRLGPFYFVPQFTRVPGNDPWSHRKGEPRPMALLWAVYLMVGALMTVFAVRSVSIPSAAQFIQGCRAMLTLTAAGICVLWPMVRLSQELPARPGRAVALDGALLLVPVQAVAWPMPMLTHWGWDVNAALVLLLIGWATLTGGLLAFALRSSSHAGRTTWTTLFVAIVFFGPAALWALAATGKPPPFESLAWLSPFTGIVRIVQAPSGVQPAMTGDEWLGAAAPVAAGALVWAAWLGLCAAELAAGRNRATTTLR